MMLIRLGVVAVAIGTVLTAAVLGVIAWWNRYKPGIRWFALHTMLVSLWALVNLVSISADSASVTLTLGLFSNGLALPVALSWFLFIVVYLGRGRWVTRRRGYLVLLGGGGLYVLLYLTAPVTGLLAGDARVVPWAGFSVYEADPTLLSLFVTVFALALFIIGLGLIVQAAVASDNIGKRQAALLGLAAFIPLSTALVMNVLGVVPTGSPIPQVPLVFSICLYVLALWRYDLFTLSPATERIGIERAFDSLNAGVVVVGADGVVLEANRTARAVAGEGAVVGKPVAEVFARLGTDIEQAPTTVEVENSYYRIVRSSIVEDGTVIGESVLLIDVTDERLREQRLDVLDRILRHNLRNRLTVIVGNLEAAAVQIDDEQFDDRVTRAKTAGKELIATTDKARAFEEALRERAKTAMVTVSSAVASAVEETVDRRDRSAVTTEVTEGLTVETNPLLFRLVLGNLVENAVVHNDSDQPCVTITAQAAPDGILVTVEDNGTGIPDHELEIIESGEETPLHHGSGLGLWLVTWAVPQLGGTVEFHSDESGTTVELSVPDQSVAAVESAAAD